MANSQSGDSVLQRAMRVLECFDVDSPRLTSADICRRSKLPRSTAHRLAVEMCEVGMLQRLQDGRFIVSPHAWEMFVRSNPLERLRFRAQPVLASLHSALGHYVSLCTPDFARGDVLFVERFDSGSQARILGRHASRLDLHTTSSGLVMLAFAAKEVVDQVLAEPLIDSETGLASDPEEIKAMLPKIRKSGYTHIVGGLVTENSSFAVPVFDVLANVVAAVGVVARTEEASVDEIVPALRAAGQNLSLSLRNHLEAELQ